MARRVDSKTLTHTCTSQRYVALGSCPYSSNLTCSCFFTESIKRKKYIYQSLEENVSRPHRHQPSTYHHSSGRDLKSGYRSSPYRGSRNRGKHDRDYLSHNSASKRRSRSWSPPLRGSDRYSDRRDDLPPDDVSRAMFPVHLLQLLLQCSILHPLILIDPPTTCTIIVVLRLPIIELTNKRLKPRSSSGATTCRRCSNGRTKGTIFECFL